MNLPDFHRPRSVGPGCPSDLALDEFVAGELSAEEARATQQHVDGCESCLGRVASFRAGWDAVQGFDSRAGLARLRRRLEEKPGGSRRWVGRWWVALAPGGALAAAAVLLVARPHTQGPAEATAVQQHGRTKGPFGLHVFRQAGSNSEEIVSGARVRPHDRLRFSVDLQEDGFVRILGVDSGGNLYVAWPQPGEDNERPAGGNQLLPGAVEIDDTPGTEHLFLVACHEASVAAACTASASTSVCGPGCKTVPFILDKAL